MGNYSTINNYSNGKWSHLDKYEQKCFKKIIEAYDEIMQVAEDISSDE